MKEFYWQVRVYYEDTDAGGIVYHARYLNFYERARTEMLRSIGINQETLLQQQIGFVVKQLSMNYLAAARLDALLTVLTEVECVKKASIEFKQTIFDAENKPVNQVTVVVACINVEKMKPVALPEKIAMEFRQ